MHCTDLDWRKIILLNAGLSINNIITIKKFNVWKFVERAGVGDIRKKMKNLKLITAKLWEL